MHTQIENVKEQIQIIKNLVLETAAPQVTVSQFASKGLDREIVI